MATSLFRNHVDLLSQYAAYHRDRRNIATHFVGIPLIVLGLSALLSRPQWAVGDAVVTPIGVIFLLSTLWYLSRGNLLLGLVTAAVNGALMLAGHALAAGGTASWLGFGLGAFVVGWVAQFIGHYYEGRKPAFVDDLVGLLVGPMFVVAEAMFSLGWGAGLRGEIERRAGPTHLRDLAHGAA